MKIIVRAVGKMRDRRLDALAQEYVDRVRRHLPIVVEEVDDEPDLCASLPVGTELVAMDPRGQAWSTDDFVRFVESRMTSGRRALVFVIGGADGLSADTVARAQVRWSLSKLTFPHRLARVILCEQIYRAVSHIRGEPYNR